jgi:hypothetical protein
MLTVMAEEQLFETAGDELLISVYQRQGRTLDDLPYTAEFERIYQAMVGDQGRGEPLGAMSRGDLFHRLHNLRKAGKLPRLGRAAAAPPRIDDKQEAALIELVEAEIERISLRDRLPYTNTFDRIVTAFNAQAGLSLTPHDVWRLIAKLSK